MSETAIRACQTCAHRIACGLRWGLQELLAEHRSPHLTPQVTKEEEAVFEALGKACQLWEGKAGEASS